MANPEKERKDDEKTPPPMEVLGDIEDYQKRLEKEWEKAKSIYQGKINQLMDDFLKQNAPIEEAPRPQKPADIPLEGLLSRVESTLRDADRRSKKISYLPDESAAPIQLTWDAPFHRRHKKSLIATTLLAVLAVGAGAFFYFFPPTFQQKLPYTHATDLVMTRDKIYIADWFRKGLYVHARSYGWPIVSIENLPNEFLTGFAFSEKYVWTLDQLNRKIIVHSVTADHQPLSNVSTPGPKPAGLFYDGVDLWSGDDGDKMIYRHHANDLEDIKEKFSFEGGVTLTAFQVKRGRVWILDGKSRELDVYRLQNPLKRLASFDLDPALKGATPTGFSLEGRSIYFVTENPTSLIRVSRREIEKNSSRDF